jgi:hypothetical protein
MWPFSVVIVKNSFGETLYFANFSSTASLDWIFFNSFEVLESFKE